jgi:hypothetical protein
MVESRDPYATSTGEPVEPPKKGMSTGAKVAIGCGIALVLVIIAFGIAAIVGGMFVKNKAEQLTGGLEAQQEASEKIQALERDHPFTAPAAGVVPEDLAGKFLAVTNDAWEKIQDDMEDLSERSEDIDEGGRAGLGDAMAGVQALGRTRVALAEALEDNDMPVSAYLWTGMELTRAYQALGMPPEQTGIPAQNLQLAERYRSELAEIAGDGQEGEIGKGMVLGMAWTWGMSEGTMPMGWDTMGYTP